MFNLFSVVIHCLCFVFDRYIEKRLQEALKIDKGTGCEIPQLDPFNREVTQFDKQLPKIDCKGQDWVKCYVRDKPYYISHNNALGRRTAIQIAVTNCTTTAKTVC
jgi:hypothetical protein